MGRDRLEGAHQNALRRYLELDEIEQLAKKYTRDALRIAVNPPAQAHADIELKAHLIAPREREHAVVSLRSVRMQSSSTRASKS